MFQIKEGKGVEWSNYWRSVTKDEAREESVKLRISVRERSVRASVCVCVCARRSTFEGAS